jgi:predicted kinase
MCIRDSDLPVPDSPPIASSTGKSTLAYALAPAIGAPPGALVLRSDLERKRLFGVKPTAPLPAAAYAPEVSARVFAELAERAGAALRAGHAVICDAVYGMPEQRSAIEATAADVGVPFHGLWLEAPLAVLEARVAARANDASDADVEVLRRQARAIDPAPIRWRRLPAEREVAELARAVTAALAGKEGA